MLNGLLALPLIIGLRLELYIIILVTGEASVMQPAAINTVPRK
jgi:hypothetical protein